MTINYVDTLRAEIERGRVIAVLGTGASISTTGGSTDLSWGALLQNGIEFAIDKNPNLPNTWRSTAQGDLDQANSGYSSNYLIVAEKIVSALGGHESLNFRQWLYDFFNPLTPASTALIESVAALDIPVATTNYDNLIEDVTGLGACTWRNPIGITDALRRDDKSIIHLHGHYKDPTSVVFSASSYATLSNEATVTALNRSVATLETLLFIGMGAGATDPQFESLMTWLTTVFGNAAARHYLLCLDAEVAEFQKEFGESAITPIGYGVSYSDLPTFLNTLVPSRTRDLPIRRLTPRLSALRALRRRVLEEGLFNDLIDDAETRDIQQLLIPPVLMPVSKEQYASTRDLHGSERPRRSDIRSDANEFRRLIVTGTDESGLSSSLIWILDVASSERLDVIPIMIDFRNLSKGKNPLLKAISRELENAGVYEGVSRAISKCIVAIDNVSTGDNKLLTRIFTEIDALKLSFVVLGCRDGTEIELASRFGAFDEDAAVRYLGNLGQDDIRRMIAIVDDRRGDAVLADVVHVLMDESLPRTPLTIGLLVYALLSGERYIASTSATSLLDSYANLLLGRGNPLDDPRFSLDSRDRSEVLSTLAKSFVKSNSGSLEVSETLEVLGNLIQVLGWSEEPFEIINSLIERRVLILRQGRIMYSHASLLNLFAAKQVQSDADFREVVFARPLYYRAILRHYAALARNDAEVLSVIQGLLRTVPINQVPDRLPFANEPGKEDDRNTVELENVLARLDIPGDNESEDAEDADGETEQDPWDALEMLNTLPDPYPTDDFETEPSVLRALAVVTLASNVLRDSDLVRDRELKAVTLRLTLEVWAEVIVGLEGEEDFLKMMNDLSDSLGENLKTSPDKRADFNEEFVRSASTLFGFGGIGYFLASKKLQNILLDLRNEGSLRRSPELAITSALLAYAIRIPGWINFFNDLLPQFSRYRAVRSTLRQIAMIDYILSESRKEEALIANFIVSQWLDDVAIRTPADEANARDQLTKRLQRFRLLAQVRSASDSRNLGASAQPEIEHGASPEQLDEGKIESVPEIAETNDETNNEQVP